MCHIMSLHHLLKLKGILSFYKGWLMLTQRTWTLISQLSFSSFTVRHKFSEIKNVKTRFSHAELYKIIVEDNIECVFPKVDICFRIFLRLRVTNCSAERSFSQLKYIKNPNRTTMQQGRLDALYLLNIVADVLCKIRIENLIRLCN